MIPTKLILVFSTLLLCTIFLGFFGRLAVNFISEEPITVRTNTTAYTSEPASEHESTPVPEIEPVYPNEIFCYFGNNNHIHAFAERVVSGPSSASWSASDVLVEYITTHKGYRTKLVLESVQFPKASCVILRTEG